MIGSRTLSAAAATALLGAAMPGTPSAAVASAGPITLTTHRLPAVVANELVGAAVGACAALHFRVSAAVLDADGVRQAQLRGDGAAIHTLDSSSDKAFTAVSFGADTIQLVEQAKTGPVSSSMAKIPHLLLAQGGVVIKEGAEVIGALGVGGAPGTDFDTQCARAAVAKVLRG